MPAAQAAANPFRIDLARLGYADGAIALGKALDRIAEDRPAGNRAERRRRAKAAAKAANAQRSRAPA